MPAPPLQNNFSGGTDETVITVGNSGGASGNPFTQVSGTGWSFESTDGVPSMEAINPLGADYVAWGALGSLTVPVFIRFYAFFPAFPSGAWGAGSHNNAAFSGVYVPIVFGSIGQFQEHSQGVSGGSYPTGQWFRCESRVVPSATVGENEWRIYYLPDADVNSYTSRGTRTGIAMAIADIDMWRIGGGGGGPNLTLSPRITKIAISTTDWIGPAITPTTTIVQVPAVSSIW